MNKETFQYLTLKGLAADERDRNKTSDYAHFYEWAVRYFENGIVDRNRVMQMLRKRREQVSDELFILDLIIGKEKTI